MPRTPGPATVRGFLRSALGDVRLVLHRRLEGEGRGPSFDPSFRGARVYAREPESRTAGAAVIFHHCPTVRLQ